MEKRDADHASRCILHPMRVLMISKAGVVGAYQRKLEEIAACPNIELTVVVPAEWRDERGMLTLERAYTKGYQLVVEPLLFNGSFHFHFYPRLSRLIARVQPDIVHIDEEPYNFATWHAQRLARRNRVKTLFFSWQNILRTYPFPFNRIEQDVLEHADAAIVGNQASAEVWRAKGYTGPLHVIPQFGVDPELFNPHLSPPTPLPSPSGRGERGGRQAGVRGEGFTIGYAGRLVPEKGVDILLLAAAQLPENVQVRMCGAGPEQKLLQYLIFKLGLQNRATIEPLIPSTQMPAYFGKLDCFVLPSRTRPNWKEQFGRVLIEAMACGVPVIGSTCGELPNVIGDAGLTFPEENVDALADCLRKLLNDVGLRKNLAAKGRARVLAHYTQKHIADQTVAVYRSLG
jgi:glycosyltransferase involved in cell wall biosynthesis